MNFYSQFCVMKNSEVKISFVIPVYNAEKYIEDCLNSILLQHLSQNEYEIICVNDGSIDNSEHVIYSFQQNNDVNLRLINVRNGGASKARNIGLLNASGTYIWFIDADDFIEKKAVTYLLNYIIEFDLDFLSFGMRIYDERKENEIVQNVGNKPYKKIVDGECYLKRYKVENSCCTFIFRREVAISNNVFLCEGITLEDYEFPPHLLLYCKRVSALPNVVYNYRYNSCSISRKKTENFYEYRILCFFKILDRLNEYEHMIACDKNCFSGIKGGIAYPLLSLLLRGRFSKVKKKKYIEEFYKRGIFDYIRDISKIYSKKSKFLAMIYRNPILFKLLIAIY